MTIKISITLQCILMERFIYTEYKLIEEIYLKLESLTEPDKPILFLQERIELVI